MKAILKLIFSLMIFSGVSTGIASNNSKKENYIKYSEYHSEKNLPKKDLACDISETGGLNVLECENESETEDQNEKSDAIHDETLLVFSIHYGVNNQHKSGFKPGFTSSLNILYCQFRI